MSLKPTGPLDRWNSATRGTAYFTYSKNYLSDTEHIAVVYVKIPMAHLMTEFESTTTMSERVEG
ncbi:hypothetical protein D3C85_1805110 [compost metagenome]